MATLSIEFWSVSIISQNNDNLKINQYGLTAEIVPDIWK